jgi:GDP-4-dehydro-6-deoxy-D-mannose reductase
VNVTATVRLLAEVARRRAAGEGDPAVVVVGSAEQYGAQPAEAQPLPETAEQRPLTLYAATKSAQEVFALQAWRRDGVRVICTRSFNHTGAGQTETFLLPALVRRALGLRPSGERVLRLGNTSPVRDVSHVSDVVSAYITLAERGAPGTAYNVARGVGHSVRELAETVLRRVGVEAELVEDPALVRPVDVPILVGDAGRLRALGWAPHHSLDDCIDDLIDAATH